MLIDDYFIILAFLWDFSYERKLHRSLFISIRIILVYLNFITWNLCEDVIQNFFYNNKKPKLTQKYFFGRWRSIIWIIPQLSQMKPMLTFDGTVLRSENFTWQILGRAVKKMITSVKLFYCHFFLFQIDMASSMRHYF